MRKYYIDNLRILCILLLFPFHTFMIYNNWGDSFYIHGASLSGTSYFNRLVYPWWMDLLFVLAGISTAYALKKRSIKEYTKERTFKLLIPLLVGLIMVIPVQTYIAYIFHNGYSGNYFQYYKRFFTTLTDFSGYDGAFTPAHLWFMLYLFIISIVMIPFIKMFNNKRIKIDGNKITVPILILLFVIVLLATPILDIGGKSVGESIACFAIGYFILSIDIVEEKLGKCWVLLLVIFIISGVFYTIVCLNIGDSGLVWDIVYRIYLWCGILSLLSLSKKFLNFTNNITIYFSRAAFPLYYFHQSILVVVGFFVLKYIENIVMQICIIIFVTFILSILAYEIFRRFKITARLFGIKYINV